MLLLKYLVDSVPVLRSVAELLDEAQSVDAAAVEAILGNPWVAVRLARFARQPTSALHCEAMSAVALAAAVRVGLPDRRVLLTPTRGAVMVPTLGMLRRDGPGRFGAPDLCGPDWYPVRAVRAECGGQRMEIAVEDLDPYRDCHGHPVRSRLTEPEFHELDRLFSAAWRLLVVCSPARAAEVAAGLTALVPLGTARRVSSDVGAAAPGCSATNEDAFGGFGTTLPRDPVQLAVTMVHEIQHSKLCALGALVPLSHTDHSATYFAPWRPDPRPLSGLLQGIYAFVAVAEFWADLGDLPEFRGRAMPEFAATRAQVRHALTGIENSPGLTPAGRRFVDQVSARVRRLGGVVVDASAERDVSARLADLETRWRARRLDRLR
ncbi:aKG-HExxH-type peptide beta-hydroxylase [Plantactinospora sp. KLBMP9567]|uniref:aKG-HExxH-type peptide beta-hydroxylase n=1 Tax=Plantactinospora sp. KLBMP9567 TaxID=3085900 RepID=UPI00298256C6|nr:HEXXH motif-containing putative peptide modification protein [Plantactinospora sp. KLBMP9567]MDW5326823.1 HEXXH motif-containing putative peptide modification protein [Plantactinospora sp. KLBMP9567]